MTVWCPNYITNRYDHVVSNRGKGCSIVFHNDAVVTYDQLWPSYGFELI